MPEQVLELQVGETLRIGDFLLTVVDVENGGAGEAAFRIESGSTGVWMPADDGAVEGEGFRMRALAK